MGRRAVDPERRFGYVLGDKVTVDDVLALEASLLRSEGLDPAWPGFDDTESAAAADGSPAA